MKTVRTVMELRRLLERARPRPIRLVVLVACANALATVDVRAHVEAPVAKDGVVTRSRLLTERRMPAFRVQDPSGRALTETDFLGNWTYVLLGYTSCPDACPTTLATLTLAFDRLQADTQRVRALFLSVDPQRDRPEVLSAYLANFSPRISAGTGSPAHMAATAQAFGMRFDVIGDQSLPTYTIDHPVAMLLFDPEGRFVTLVPHGVTAAELVADLRNRLHLRKSP